MTVDGKGISDADHWVLSALCSAVMWGDKHPGFMPEGAREQYLEFAKEIIERIKRNEQAENH